MSKILSVLTRSVVIITLCLSVTLTNQAQIHAERPMEIGYISTLQNEGTSFLLEPIALNGQNIELQTSVANSIQISLSDSSRNPISEIVSFGISPDLKRFHAISVNETGEFNLEVTPITDSTLSTVRLHMGTSTTSGYVAHWEDTGNLLFLYPYQTTQSTLLYNPQNGALLPITEGYVSPIRTLLPNQQFIFMGSSVCGAPCNASSDIYLGRYDSDSIIVNPITNLSAVLLGVQNRLMSSSLGISHATFNPNDERIYMGVKESPSEPGRMALFYSVDFAGNFRQEFDFLQVLPRSDFPPVIKAVFSSILDSENIYLLLETDEIEGQYSWTLARYSHQEGFHTIFEDRTSDTTLQTIRTQKVSPNGQYLAIGSQNQTQDMGKVIVVDILSGQPIVVQNTSRSVCDIYWTPDNLSVIYTHATNSKCVNAFLENQPVNTLIALKLADGSNTMIKQDLVTPFYILMR